MYMYGQCLLSVCVNNLGVSVYSAVSNTHSSRICWMKRLFIITFPSTRYGSWWEEPDFGMMVKLIRKPASYFSTLSIFFRCFTWRVKISTICGIAWQPVVCDKTYKCRNVFRYLRYIFQTNLKKNHDLDGNHLVCSSML